MIAAANSPKVSAPQKVAVIGAGAAGIAAAWMLQQRHHVTLIEQRQRLGGHVHTVVIPDGPDAGTPVDTGFIVMNDRNYPIFTRFLERLDVPVADSDMSFAFACRRTGFEYNGSSMSTLFARRRNLASPGFLLMLRDILRFNKQARADLPALQTLGPSGHDQSLGDYLDRFGFRSPIIERYIVPMGAAIWSTSMAKMMHFPARAFIQFFDNHGLLSVNDRPQWKYLPGGSKTYVDTFERAFRKAGGDIRTGVSLRGVRRSANENHVELRHADGATESFDQVVIATHADQALALLEDPSPDERALLGAWEYSHNRTVLHRDAERMPRRRKAWASWNVIRRPDADDEQPVHLTYHMNRLQQIDSRSPYFVTLNDPTPWRDETVVREMDYLHPLYTSASFATQPRLAELNGSRHTWFAGAYHGYGFHEDAIRSGMQVGEALGGVL